MYQNSGQIMFKKWTNRNFADYEKQKRISLENGIQWIQERHHFLDVVGALVQDKFELALYRPACLHPFVVGDCTHLFEGGSGEVFVKGVRILPPSLEPTGLHTISHNNEVRSRHCRSQRLHDNRSELTINNRRRYSKPRDS
jgi:hypothetical protein